jgi:anti-sigma B factor antagonist
MSAVSGNTSAFAVGRTTIGGSLVLSPTGALTYETCTELRDALQQAAETPRANVVLDCRQVALMDSEALQLLVEWDTTLREGGGALKLSNLNEVCSDIFVVTRLVHVLTLFDDLKQAVGMGGTA